MVALQQLLPQRAATCPKALAGRRQCVCIRTAALTDRNGDGPSASGRAADSVEDGQASSLQQSQLEHLGRASKLLAATAVIYHIAFSSNAVRAEDRPWKPRRHHRRLGERFTDTWAEELVEEQESAREKRQDEARVARLRIAEQREADQRRIREEEEALKRRAQEILIQQHEAARGGGLPFKLMIRGTDFAPLVVWSAILAALVAAYRSRLLTWLTGSGRRQPAGGKWVYDRSLGGRKVWVPDSSAFSGPTSATSLSEKAGRSLKDEEFERLASFAAAARTAAPAADAGVLPSWWDPPPVLYASAAKKAARAEEAAVLLRRLEGAKVAGRDYELADIRALRRACQDGHVSVKPKTVGGRDAIFRAAVEAAVESAQSRNNEPLDDVSPPRWVAGVAADLGMEDGRALGIVAAVAASAVRARLLDAVTSLRSGNTAEAVYALARMASLLELLPVLQPGAMQVEAVASSLRDRSSVAERQMMFHLLAQLYEEGATVSAELLGFDPQLVLQEQREALEAARAGAGVATGQQGQGQAAWGRQEPPAVATLQQQRQQPQQEGAAAEQSAAVRGEKQEAGVVEGLEGKTAGLVPAPASSATEGEQQGTADVRLGGGEGKEGRGQGSAGSAAAGT